MVPSSQTSGHLMVLTLEVDNGALPDARMISGAASKSFRAEEALDGIASPGAARNGTKWKVSNRLDQRSDCHTNQGDLSATPGHRPMSSGFPEKHCSYFATTYRAYGKLPSLPLDHSVLRQCAARYFRIKSPQLLGR